jgi:hypothetical protein
LEILPAGEGRFGLFDDFNRIGNTDGVVDKDGIFEDFVFVQILVSLQNQRVAFVFDINGIVMEN